MKITHGLSVSIMARNRKPSQRRAAKQRHDLVLSHQRGLPAELRHKRELVKVGVGIFDGLVEVHAPRLPVCPGWPHNSMTAIVMRLLENARCPITPFEALPKHEGLPAAV